MSGPNIGKRALRTALVAAAFLPAAVPLWLIIRDGVDVPYYDEWDVGPPILEKAHNGTLGLADLFALHNEHRLLVTRLVVLAGGYLTHYNVKTLMFVTFAVACATSVLIYLLGRQTRLRGGGAIGDGGSGNGVLGAFFVPLLTNLLLFSPVQYENWLWSMQIQFLMPSLCLVAGLLIAGSNSSTPLRFLSGMFLSFVGTYSAANGMLLWPLLLPSLLLTGPSVTRTAKLRWTVLWLLAAAAVVLPYFYGYHKPADHPSLFLVFKIPLEFIKFVLIYLGAPLTIVDQPANTILVTASRTPALLVGLGLLLLFFVACLYCRHGKGRFLISALPWLTLGTYAIATDVATGLARVGFGAHQALWSRYTTIAICLIISVVHLVPMICEDVLQAWKLRNRPLGSGPNGDPSSEIPWEEGDQRLSTRPTLSFARFIQSQPERAGVVFLCGALGVALCVLHLAASSAALEMSRKVRVRRLAGKTSLLLIRSLDDRMLLGLAPNEPDYVKLVRNGAEILQSLGDVRPGLIDNPRITALLNRDSGLSTDAGEGGALERAGHVTPEVFAQVVSNPDAAADMDDDLRMAIGWAVFPALHRPADSVILTYQVGTSEPIIFGVAQVGRDRPDVVQATGHSSFLYSGWIRLFLRTLLPKEELKIQAWAFDVASAKAYPLAGSAKLEPLP